MSRKLYRSTKDRMLAGVAGGLGEYFEIDSTLIRILFVITLFIGGTGIFAYILLWIVVPEYPYYGQVPPTAATDAGLAGTAGFSQSADVPPSQPESDVENYLKLQEERKKKRVVFGGIILIIIGVIFLADNFIPRFSASDLLPILIVAVGIGILLNATKKKQ